MVIMASGIACGQVHRIAMVTTDAHTLANRLTDMHPKRVVSVLILDSHIMVS